MLRSLSIATLLYSLTLYAQAEVADGTWKWSSNMGDQTIDSTLYLTANGTTLEGRYEDQNIQQEIENGKVDGNEISFQIPVEFNGQSILVNFQGTLKEEGIDGTVHFEVDGVQQGEDYPWEPKRHVGAEEVVGTWNFRYTAPDGVEYTPALVVSEMNGKLSGEITGDSGTIKVESLRIDDGNLTFGYSIPYQGSDLELNYNCQPRGHKMSGTLEYEVDGNRGEFEVEATRKQLPSELRKLLGTWEFVVTGDDGLERRPVMTLSEKDGELSVSLADEGETFDLKNLTFANGQLSFGFSRSHDGMNVDVEWTCKPDGDDMKGSLEYNADGNFGEIPFTGKRKS